MAERHFHGVPGAAELQPEAAGHDGAPVRASGSLETRRGYCLASRALHFKRRRRRAFESPTGLEQSATPDPHQPVPRSCPETTGRPVLGVIAERRLVPTIDMDGAEKRRASRLYPASARRTLPRPSSMTAAAVRAAAAPKANVAPGPTALQSRPPMVLALKLATPVAV
jgi:hypothetical protein